MFDLSGLYSVLAEGVPESEPIPLLSVEVRAEVKNFLAEMELVQRYQNKEDRALEVLYSFPVEESSSVIGFKATLEGKYLSGVL